MTNATITAGTKLITDSRLAKGWTFEGLQTSDWAAAPFVLPGRDLIPAQAVSVKVTGRTVRYDAPKLGGIPVVRVEVTFVPDGEDEAVVVGGWALANTMGE